eukprot:534510_1
MLAETWCAWLASTITALIVSILIIFIFKVICQTKEVQQSNYSNPDTITTQKGNAIFTFIGITCLITFWFRAIIQFIVFTVLLSENENEQHISKPLVFSWLFYGVGLWLMMLSFVLRIQYTFKGTYLEYSPIIIRILYILLGLALIEVISIGVINGAMPSLYKEGLIIAYIAIISHFLFSILLTYLLFTKIFVVMQHRLRERFETNDSSQQEMTTINNENNINAEAQTPTMHQISLRSIKSVTRYALLMFMGIISTYIVSVLVFIDIEYGWSVSAHILTYGQTLIGLDLLINSIAVYLLFQQNSKIYFAVCKICHIGCESFCIQITYLYSKKSKRNGINSSANSRQEFATLILTADDDNQLY